jgi:hypothetical protein
LLPLGGGRAIPPLRRPSRTILIISHSDTNLYRKTILIGHRRTSEALAPASRLPRISA